MKSIAIIALISLGAIFFAGCSSSDRDVITEAVETKCSNGSGSIEKLVPKCSNDTRSKSKCGESKCGA